MKFIKIVLRDKKRITLPFDKAQKILDSQSQIIKIMDDETGEWTGESINKSEIIWTERDIEEERDWKRDNVLKLDEHKQTPEEKKHVGELIKKYRPKWMEEDETK